MGIGRTLATRKTVALLAEGVDRNILTSPYSLFLLASPSSRRAWIEICEAEWNRTPAGGRPPRGGRG